MAGCEHLEVSPGSCSHFASFFTCACAVARGPGNKQRMTSMTYFPSLWPPHAPAKIVRMLLLEARQNFFSKYKCRDTKNKQW